jgi:putative CocE/NonD family hydrolase
MEAVDWAHVYEHLPLRTMDEQAGRVSAQWREELDHPTLDDYWQPLCYQDRLERVNVPVLHISGWYDDEQIGTPRNFAAMRARAATPEARDHQKLLMGPWGHAVNKTGKLGEVDFGPQALIDLRAYQERWFARWLKGEGNGVEREPRAHIFVMGANAWRDEDDWPPARAQATPFYLHSAGRANGAFGDGALSAEAPLGEPPDAFDYDPQRPVPFITEPLSSQIGGPDDYSGLIRRGDLLWYVSAPLEQALEVTGPLSVVLYAASSAPDTDFTALLCDVWPTGFAQRLADGIVRARYRNGLQRAEPIEPGRVYRYTIDCWHTAQVFLPGHRIGVMIASSAFPKYDRNLNTGGSLADGTEMAVAHQRVFHDAERASHVLLPVMGA